LKKRRERGGNFCFLGWNPNIFVNSELMQIFVTLIALSWRKAENSGRREKYEKQAGAQLCQSYLELYGTTPMNVTKQV
jgi:hypothetical protein